MSLFENPFGGGGKKDGISEIIITNVNLAKKNKWRDPQIQLWLAAPVGPGNRAVDAKLPLEGKVINPPRKGFVRAFIILSKDGSIWPQCDCTLDGKGEWKAGVYLALGPGEEYKKTILVQLYEVKEGNEAVKILENEFVIE
jgi:hypothetical protein